MGSGVGPSLKPPGRAGIRADFCEAKYRAAAAVLLHRESAGFCEAKYRAAAAVLLHRESAGFCEAKYRAAAAVLLHRESGMRGTALSCQ